MLEKKRFLNKIEIGFVDGKMKKDCYWHYQNDIYQDGVIIYTYFDMEEKPLDQMKEYIG